MNHRNILNVGIAGYGLVGKRRRAFIDIHPHLKTKAVSDIKFKDNFSDNCVFLKKNIKTKLLIAPKKTITFAKI